MAFSFSPKYTQDIPLENLTSEQFLVLAIEAAKKLDWNIGYTSETGFLAYTPFSLSSYSEEVKIKIEEGNAHLKSECTGSQLVDWGKNKSNIESLVSTIAELKNTTTPEELSRKFDDIKPTLISKEEDLLNQPPATTKENVTSFFAIFKPTKGYFITPILINLNITIFILMILSGVNWFLPETESLIKWGANFRPVTLEGEWWRLFTNIFLHIGVFHLLLNMYALLYIGLLLEPHLGKIRFLSAYLLTGITASLASLWWHDFTVSAGASGAIFGMYGVFLAMLTTNLIEKSARKALITSIAIFVGYNLLNGMKGGIDNAAHIGGLLAGLLIGYAFIPGLRKPNESNKKFLTIGIMSALVLGVCIFAFKKIPNDIPTYDKKINEFTVNESLAVEVYSLPEGTPKEKLLYNLKDRGIYYWKENINLLNDLETLNLPDAVHERNQRLIKYCELRIKSYTLLYKSIEEDTDIYNDSITYYNTKIENIIKVLKGNL
ncbi:MAG: gluP [Bacteroidetes bacterium]|jgi:rhomboid protease GluP|nr:gluP [Bacteroidota bacterium]